MTILNAPFPEERSPSLSFPAAMTYRNHILFVYPPVMRKFPPTDAPFGMMYLAAIMREAGIDVRILDLNALRWSEEKVEAFFRENSYPIVGLGGMTTVYYYVKWLASLIHRVSPKTILIGGGSLATPCPEIILDHTPLSAVCIGEGEPIIVELIQRLIAGKPLKDIHGLAFRDGSGKIVKTPVRSPMNDLDTLPFPAYDLVDMDIYLENATKRPSLTAIAGKRGIPLESISKPFIMFSSRGCPFSCTFCYRNFGNQVRRHSIGYLFEHIRYVAKKFGVNNIAFYDETFNSNRSWVLDFCRQAREETPRNFYWMGGARVDLLDNEVLEALKSANFYEISVGVESFDDRILQEMGKKFDSRTLLDALLRLKANGMGPSYLGMLYGFPGDDRLSLHRSLKAICRVGIPAYFQFPLPFPGTIIFEKLRQEGRILDIERFMLEMADCMAQDLFFNISRYPDKKLIKMVHHAEGKIAACLRRKSAQSGLNGGRWQKAPFLYDAYEYSRNWAMNFLKFFQNSSMLLKRTISFSKGHNEDEIEKNLAKDASRPKLDIQVRVPSLDQDVSNHSVKDHRPSSVQVRPSRALRVALLGNMANNAFNMTNILRREGIFAQLIDDGKDLFPFSRPMWEECEIAFDYAEVMQSEWTFDRWLEIERRAGWQNGRRVIYPHLDAFPSGFGHEYENGMLAPFDEECRVVLRQISMTYSRTIEALKKFDVIIGFGFYAAICAYFAKKPTIYFTYGGDCRLELADYDGSRQVVSKCFERILNSYFFVIEGYGCDKEIHDILRARNLLGKVSYVFLPNINTELFRKEWVKETSRAKLSWPSDKLILLLASRVDYYWKGSDIFLEAFGEFAKERQNVLLVITGWGKDYPDARKRIEERGLLSKVLFLPESFSKPKLFERYAAADLIIDQFKVGSLGSVSYEALCMGKPVLAYLAPFNLRCFPHPPPILNAQTENDIIKKLEYSAANPDGLIEIGKSGAKWYKNLYSEKNLSTCVQSLATHGAEKWVSYADVRNRSLPDHKISVPNHEGNIRILPWPYPYRSGLTIANDCEYYCWQDFCDLHRLLNSCFVPEIGKAVRLPISDSFWFYSEDPPNLGFSYFEGTDCRRQSQAAPYLAELLKIGIIDTLHAYGGFDIYGGFRRDHAEVALDVLDRMGIRLKVWTNHGNENNAQNIGGLWANDYSKGDRPGTARYHTDLLLKAGFRYFWLDSYSTNRFSLGNPNGGNFESELAGRDESPFGDNILCRERLLDGQEVLAFRRFRGLRRWAPDPSSLADQLSSKNLDHLEETAGAAIIYQHFGCSRDREGDPSSRRGRPIPPEAQKQFQDLAGRFDAKRTWVAPCSFFLRYLETVSDLRLDVKSRGEGVILQLYGDKRDLKEDDLLGIHLHVEGKINVVGIEMISCSQTIPCKSYLLKQAGPDELIIGWEEPSWPDFPFTGKEIP